jgi:hypothetical protein
MTVEVDDARAPGPLGPTPAQLAEYFRRRRDDAARDFQAAGQALQAMNWLAENDGAVRLLGGLKALAVSALLRKRVLSGERTTFPADLTAVMGGRTFTAATEEEAAREFCDELIRSWVEEIGGHRGLLAGLVGVAVAAEACVGRAPGLLELDGPFWESVVKVCEEAVACGLAALPGVEGPGR